jgi:hypothetical protein
LPNSLTTHRAHPPHPASKADFFTEAVHDAVDRIGLQCPDDWSDRFGIEDVLDSGSVRGSGATGRRYSQSTEPVVVIVACLSIAR